MAREMTGATAFNSAKASASLSRSGTVAAADQATQLRLDELVVNTTSADGRERREVQRAGGRLFLRRSGVWTDVAHRDSLKVTTIAPFSPAYFALAAARPALRAMLAVGTPVLVAGRRASVKVAEGGATEWTPGALERFLQEFDGR